MQVNEKLQILIKKWATQQPTFLEPKTIFLNNLSYNNFYEKGNFINFNSSDFSEFVLRVRLSQSAESR